MEQLQLDLGVSKNGLHAWREDWALLRLLNNS